jgi:hypothetical protein
MHYAFVGERGFPMRVRLLLVVSAIGMCGSVAALAEPPIGSRLGERIVKGTIEDEATSARHAQQYAGCLVNRRLDKVQRLLSQTNEAGYKAAYKELTTGRIDCFDMGDDLNDITEGWRFSIPPEIMRGILAEQLIRHDIARYAGLAVLSRQRTYSRAWYGATNRDVSVDEMATCVSETDAPDTLSLLKTEPYSDQEGTAFAALGATLGACLRAGVKVTGNRQSLRAALADALYQRVANPIAATAGGPQTAKTR